MKTGKENKCINTCFSKTGQNQADNTRKTGQNHANMIEKTGGQNENKTAER